jgi:hypothetical protein
LQPTLAGRTFGLAGGTGDITLTNAALNIIRAVNVRIGNSTAGNINIGNLTSAANFASGILTLSSAGTITQAIGTALNLAASNSGLLLRNASSVTLANNNDISNVSAANVGAVTINNSSARALTSASQTDDIGTANGINSSGAVLLTSTASGNVLNAPIMAVGSGNSIVLAGTSFTNNIGASALDPGAGSFLVWSANPANDSRGGLAYNFKQYNATYDVTSVLGTGDGFLYSIAPSVTASLVGSTSKIYDANTAATLASNNYALSGAIDGDTVTITNPVNGTYNNKNVGSSKQVTSDTISITSATDGSATVYGYQLAVNTATGNIGSITPASLTITGVTADNKVYDATTAATLNTASAALSGVLGADTVNLDSDSATGTFATKNVGNAIAVTGSGFTTSGADSSNYTLTQPAYMTANITPATLTITGVTANNKIYDGNTQATLNLSSSALIGILGSDNVTVNPNGYNANFITDQIGNLIPVIVSNLGLQGSASANYTLTQPTGLTANITSNTNSSSLSVESTNSITSNNQALLSSAESTLNLMTNQDYLSNPPITMLMQKKYIKDKKAQLPPASGCIKISPEIQICAIAN